VGHMVPGPSVELPTGRPRLCQPGAADPRRRRPRPWAHNLFARAGGRPLARPGNSSSGKGSRSAPLLLPNPRSSPPLLARKWHGRLSDGRSGRYRESGVLPDGAGY
jgi:hypothetical protein